MPQFCLFLNKPQNAPLDPRDVIGASSEPLLVDTVMKLDLGNWLYFTNYYILNNMPTLIHIKGHFI